MRKYWILFVIAFAAIAATAQNTRTAPQVTITGQVTDLATQEPEPTAMICIATQAQPKVAIKKAVTDTLGRFAIAIPATAGQYRLSASVMGKKAVIVDFGVAAGDTAVALGTIQMADDARLLNEVEVVAQKPLVVMDVDKLTYDVASDPDARMMSTSEILNKVPLVDVDGDGNIRMNGTTKFLILQNGRRTAVTRHPKDILRSLPAELVQRIEVISSPGAKYDAEGIGGIINIVMQRRYEGHLTTLNGAANSFGYMAGVMTTTKLNKFSIDGYVNYNRILQPTSEGGQDTYNQASDTQAHETRLSKTKSRGNTEFANINASYEIDSLRLLTLSLSGMGSQQRTPVWGSTETWNPGHTQMAYGYSMSSSPKMSFINGTAGIDYQRIGRREKQRMSTLSYQISTNPSWTKDNTLYSEIVNHTGSDIAEMLQLYDNRTDGNNKSVEHTIQYDYTSPLGKSMTIETGMKYILRNNESTNDIFDARAGSNDYTLNALRSNHYKNRNDILAAYLSYTYRSRLFSFMPGLRYEYTYQDIKYLSGAIGSEGNYSGHYAYLVPSGKVSLKVGKGQTLRLEYAMRLSRPSIYYLNPYFNDLTPQHISQGNGSLEAERSHNLGLTYGSFTRKLNMNLSLSYRRLNNGIERVSHIVGSEGEYFDQGRHYAAPGAIYTTYANIGRTESTSLNAYIRWNTTRRLSLTFNGDVAYLDMQDPARQLRNHGWTTSLSTMASLSLPAGWRLNGQVRYGSRSVTLQGNGTSMFTYYMSLGRSFLKDNRLSLSLSAMNILQNWDIRRRTTMGTNFYTQSWDQIKRRMVSFTVMYRFGRLKQSATKRARHGINNDDLKRGQ